MNKPTACHNGIRHSPKPAYLQKHHIVPKSWGGLDEVSNYVYLCGTCHDGIHAALNACVTAKDIPEAKVWTVYHPYYRRLARIAVERAGGVKPKFTMSHGEEP